MAESAVKSSVNLLGKILVDEGKYLWGVEGKVKELRDELLWMRSFLRKADTSQYKDEIVWMWVCQVQNHVYEAEDIIDDFVIKVVSSRQQNGLLNNLKRYSCIFKELYDLHQTASSIDSLKVEISTLSPKLEKYGLMRSLGINTDEAKETRIEQIQRIQRYVHMEDKKIVGLEKNAKEIINTLISTKSDKGFHAIYGMGGSGKTTLAIKVSNDDEVKKHFLGGQAFAYISKQFQIESVVRDLLQSLDSKESYSNLKEKDLVSKLQEFLKKKCLIVLDDVWTKQAWDSLNTVFTSCGGDSGSKLLLTTRKEEVAKYVDSNALQKPDLLNEEESWQLLRETMGWEPQESSTHEQDKTETAGDNDVSAKIELGKQMAKMCKGVPLAIVVLGGILGKKQTLAEWRSVLNNISSHLIRGYDHGRSCMEILLKSYDDLPYHLKPCFLHLANFPEDYKIETENLYWMWVAEGLVTRLSRTTGTKSLEDFANDYLIELAQAGLVEIVEMTSEGWIGSIRMHDLVRDVCLEKATADNFLKTIDLRSCPDQQLDTSDYYSEMRLLRMAVYLPHNKSIDSFIKDSLSTNAPKYLRSLFFTADGLATDKGEYQQLVKRICSKFQLLRVLVLSDADLNGGMTSQVEKLMHLRYLSLKDTRVSELPASIGKLRFLEILDLRYSGFKLRKLIIPNTLWKLFRLRHLLFPRYYEIKWPSKRLRVDTLICLERMENLRLKNLRTKDMLKIKNLRNLSITDAVSKEAIRDIMHILKSGRLQNCVLKELKGDVISEDPKVLSAIVGNCELSISGQISVPENVDFLLPHYLKELTLVDCQLTDDPMRILGSLCHLKTLYLYNDSYVGTKMTCHSKSFPHLMKLEIWTLKKLEVWELEHGSMASLESLEIWNCTKLNRIPDVLPLSLKIFSSNKNGGDEEGGVNLDSSGAQIVNPCDYSGGWLKEAVLKGEHTKVVILGSGGAGKATNAMKHLYWDREIHRGFDAVARTWVPRRKSTESGGGTGTPSLLPRPNLQQLLRDLTDHHQDLSQMSCEELIHEIHQVMQERKCLVILLNLEVGDFDHLEPDLEKTFGPQHQRRGMSKIVITSQSESESKSDIQLPASDIAADCHLFKLRPPTHLESWEMLWFEDSNYCIKWNMLRYCPRHPLSVQMLVGLLKMKERENSLMKLYKMMKITESSPLEFSHIFALCYNDLQPHLRRCLLYLANFPEEVEISTKKLYKMWIAGGFVGSEQTEESLETLASSYLAELVKRGMVTVVKEGLAERVKTCQLKFALRDLCLAKAKEDPMLTIVDRLEHSAASTSDAKFKIQPLAVHLDQNSVTPTSLVEKLRSLQFSISPTSLLFFPDVSDPVYNEENWEWLLYICKHFASLWVLDLEGMWMSKGSLPMEIGNLTHLRYLSLRGTWVTQLPSSIGDLSSLQTLDLRVLESIFIPDVLWKLDRLMHLYLPDSFAQETAKLRLCGLKSLQTLGNLHTDKVCLNDLVELKLLREISIRKIHCHAVDKLDGILNQLSTSLEVCINAEIINVDPTILGRFQNLRKVKIKGVISAVLHPEMFPTHLEELTLKHTKLEEDSLPVLEKLLQLRSLFLDHESFLGKEMKFSKDFYDRANLILSSLSNLEQLYVPEDHWRRISPQSIVIIDCWRLVKKEFSTDNSRCIDMSPLKKGLQPFTCW